MDTVLQIEAINGPLRGGVWRLSTIPLVVGRSVGCHIRLNDPVASRRHCEIMMESGVARVRDLGSSNAILLNGTPVRDAALAPGDEFAVGNSMFRVSRAADPAPVDTGAPTPATTAATLLPAEHAYLQIQSQPDGLSATPRTVQELHDLFTISRHFSMETSLSGLWDVFSSHLEARFSPEDLWVARYIAQEESLVPHPTLRPQEKMPQDKMLECVALKQATLLPRQARKKHGRVLETTMFSPIAAGNEVVGVVGMSTSLPKGLYDTDDLKYLLALCVTIGPYVLAVERHEQLRRDQARQSHPQCSPGHRLLGDSAAIVELREMVRRAASSRLSVVLEGESGTGKELVARMLHDLSGRMDQPYVVVNCAALPSNLFESEMFGHEKGAFTGAHARHIGRFEEAHAGTLFLDEIADCSRENQARMLRVLESGTFHRVGGTAEVHVDTRIVAASNKPLFDEVLKGSFREDLFYRLGGVVLRLPPLRSIPEDIPLLAAHFLEQSMRYAQHPLGGFSPETLRLLQGWRWPGNVRELRACVERAVLVAQGPLLEPHDIAIPGAPHGAAGAVSSELPSLQEVEQRHIETVFKECGGKVRQAARVLGISHVTLYTRLHQYGIETDPDQKGDPSAPQ